MESSQHVGGHPRILLKAAATGSSHAMSGKSWCCVLPRRNRGHLPQSQVVLNGYSPFTSSFSRVPAVARISSPVWAESSRTVGIHVGRDPPVHLRPSPQVMDAPPHPQERVKHLIVYHLSVRQQCPYRRHRLAPCSIGSTTVVSVCCL